MKRICVLKFAALAAAACWSMAGQAATVWDEAIQGELSGDRLQPTDLVAATGDNLVFGTVGNAGQGIDRDYFSFNVPTNAWLDSIRLSNNSQVSGSTSFLALQAGPQITTTPGGVGVRDLLGFIHYDPSMIGQNLLPLMGVVPVPLPAGRYSVWVQELDGPVPYGLNFVLSAVPEPSVALLLLAGLAGLPRRRR